MADNPMEFSDREIDHIAQQLAKQAEPANGVVEGMTFDLTDEEIQKAYILVTALTDKYARHTMDLRTQMNIKADIVGKFAQIGLVAEVGWIYTQNGLTGFTVVTPDVTIIDRVGGLQWESDIDRKRWDAQRRTIDEIAPDSSLVKKLVD